MKWRVADIVRWFYYGLSVIFVGVGICIIMKLLPAGGLPTAGNRWLLGSVFLIYGVYRFTGLILRGRRNETKGANGEDFDANMGDGFMDKKNLT